MPEVGVRAGLDSMRHGKHNILFFIVIFSSEMSGCRFHIVVYVHFRARAKIPKPEASPYATHCAKMLILRKCLCLASTCVNTHT